MVDQSKYNHEYYMANCDGNNDGSLCGRQLSLIKYLSDNDIRILDIGSGRGELAKNLVSRQVISLDYSIAAMEIFHKNNGDRKTYIRHDVTCGVPWLTDCFFDTIILLDIIEHLPSEYINIVSNDILRILRSNGRILIDTPICEGDSSSELHINIQKSVEDVVNIFQSDRYKTELISSEWFIKPEHCHIVLRKVDR